MKKRLLATSILLMTTGLLAKPVEGPYVGLGVGSTVFSDGGFSDDLKAYATRIGSTVTIHDNYNSSGYKLYGGYQFNNVVALEVSYTSYGKHSLELSSGNKAELEPKAFGIGANIGYNLGEKNEYRPFAIIGLSNLNINESGDIRVYDSGTTTSVEFGFGFEYIPYSLDGIGFRIAYEGDFYGVKDTNPSNVPELSNSYTNNLGMLYLSAQYKF